MSRIDARILRDVDLLRVSVQNEPDGIHHFRLGDEVINRAGLHGSVLSVSVLYALIGFDDGSVIEIEQDDPGVYVQRRSELGHLSLLDRSQLEDVLKQLKDERDRKEDEIEDLRGEVDDLEDQIEPLRSALQAMAKAGR